MIGRLERESIVRDWEIKEKRTIEVDDCLSGPAKALARVALFLSNEKNNGAAQKVKEIEAAIGLNGGRYLYEVDLFPPFFESSKNSVLALVVHDEDENRPKVHIPMAMGIVKGDLILAALHKPELPVVSYRRIGKRGDVLSADGIYGGARDLESEIISFLSNKDNYDIDSSGAVFMNFVDILMTS